MTGTDKDTVTKILVEVGSFASEYQNLVLRSLSSRRVEADEIWAFVGAKQGNATKAGQGDIWTYTGLCADTKLMISWLVGKRTPETTQAFIRDLASRLAHRIQLSTDSLPFYRPAVEKAFGWNGCDFATITKKYKGDASAQSKGRYSPSPEVASVEKVKVMGNPRASLVSTSYVERTNLAIRTNVRRFTRLTNAFSRKAENHAHAVSLHFMAHNFLRAHGTLTAAAKGYKTSPAMAAGLTNHVWTVEEMPQKVDATFMIAAASRARRSVLTPSSEDASFSSRLRRVALRQSEQCVGA